MTEQSNPEVPVGKGVVQIEIDSADGGILLRMGGFNVDGTPLPIKSRVVEGDPTSDSFKRKVQRTVVTWAKKVYFQAPPRKKPEAVNA